MPDESTAPPDDMRFDVFQALYEAWVEGKDTPERFVGLQGDNIVVIAKGGHYYTIIVAPSKVTVGA